MKLSLVAVLLTAVTITAEELAKDVKCEKGIDLVLIFDSSDSVDDAEFKYGTTFAKKLVEKLGQDQEGSKIRFAAITFNVVAEVNVPLSSLTEENLEKITTLQNSIETKSLLSPALNETKKLLSASQGEKVIVIISDGNYQDTAKSIDIVKTLQKEEIHVITIGNTDHAWIPFLRDYIASEKYNYYDMKGLSVKTVINGLKRHVCSSKSSVLPDKEPGLKME